MMGPSSASLTLSLTRATGAPFTGCTQPSGLLAVAVGSLWKMPHSELLHKSFLASFKSLLKSHPVNFLWTIHYKSHHSPYYLRPHTMLSISQAWLHPWRQCFWIVFPQLSGSCLSREKVWVCFIYCSISRSQSGVMDLVASPSIPVERRSEC